VHEALFYCVANMPGAVPNTSTYARTNVPLPYTIAIADRGFRDAVSADPALALGVSTVGGELVNGPVGEAHGIPVRALADVVS
jgi:alanine dehydrogenase